MNDIYKSIKDDTRYYIIVEINEKLNKVILNVKSKKKYKEIMTISFKQFTCWMNEGYFKKLDEYEHAKILLENKI